MPDYIDKVKLKSDNSSCDIHDSRLSSSIGNVDTIVQESRKIADLPLSSDIAASELLNKLFKITTVNVKPGPTPQPH